MGRKKRAASRRKKILTAAAIVVAGTAAYAAWAVLYGGWPFNAIPGMADAVRPWSWATPVEDDRLENFYQVSGDLYRGAQPDREGMVRLRERGIATVVNLRKLHSDDDELAGVDLRHYHFPMTGLMPDDEDLVAFLRVVMDRRNTPVFVHCWHGSDRTGLMCAAYRIFVQGWSRAEAVREMREGGFGFHTAWGDIDGYLLDDMDAGSIRRQLGIE